MNNSYLLGEYELIPEFEMLLDREFELQYDIKPPVTSGTRESKEYIRWLQTSLNKILKLKTPLKITGIMGPGTKWAIRTFQKKAGLTQTGTVNDRTEAALVKAGASTPPVHIPTAPSNCVNPFDRTPEFWDFVQKAIKIIPGITAPPLTQRIINEINDIVGPEGTFSFSGFKIITCSKIFNPLVFGETVNAEILVGQQILHLSDDTWKKATDFLRTKNLALLTEFFQTLAHEKRHATLGNKITVNTSGVKPGLAPDAPAAAAFRIHEILVRAEEIAVGKTMNPSYKVPVWLQQLFRKNFNLAASIVTTAELARLRGVIVKELRKRYISGKGCDSSVTLGVLKCMDTGSWFHCINGSVYGPIPNGLVLCTNPDGTHRICGIH